MVFAFSVYLFANEKNQCCTSHIQCLDLYTYKFKGEMNCLILQNVPQTPCSVSEHCANLWGSSKHELEHKEKQENGCLALWEAILCYARIFCIHAKKEDLTS